MKKYLKLVLIAFIFIPCLLMFSGCNRTAYVVDIEMTQVNELYNIYTIKYSNGKEDTITIKNGQDGDDISVEKLYLAAKEVKGLGEEYTMLDFIEEYLTFDVTKQEDSNITKTCLSTVALYSVFSVTQNVITNTPSVALGAGSGVIYQFDKNSDDYYIITNYHVIYYSKSAGDDKHAVDIKAYMYGNTIKPTKLYNDDKSVVIGYDFGDQALDCSYIGGSMQYDIAVLKINDIEKLKNYGATSVNVAEMTNISIGQTMYAIGNPNGDGISVTKGVVSVDSENINITLADDATVKKMRLLRIDAAVNSGNSGGGAFNAQGELIGIVNAKKTVDKIENIGYAIPANVAVLIANKVIQNPNQTLQKANLNITYTPDNGKAVYDSKTDSMKLYEDLVIVSVDESSICNGVLVEGDIIKTVSINGKIYNIDRPYYLVDLLWNVKAGDILVFGVERNTDKLNLSIIINQDCMINV